MTEHHCPVCGAETARHVEVTLDAILVHAARRYGVSIADIVGPDRHASITEARHVVMYVAKLLTPKSYVEIGRCLGNRDHTTVISAFRKVRWALVTTEPSERQLRIRDAVEAVMLAVAPKDSLRKALPASAPTHEQPREKVA